MLVADLSRSFAVSSVSIWAFSSSTVDKKVNTDDFSYKSKKIHFNEKKKQMQRPQTWW